MGAVSTDEKAYTVKQAAEIINAHPETVRRLIARRQLTSFRVGRAHRIKAETLERFMNAN